MFSKLTLIAEQAFFSLSNFLQILILSSLMLPEEFKKWAILNIITMLGVGLNNTIVSQPYQVFINKYYGKYLFKQYLPVKYLFIVIISATVSILSFFYYHDRLIETYLFTFFMIFLLSGYELNRRILMFKKRYAPMLKSTIFYIVIYNSLIFSALQFVSLDYLDVYMISSVVLMSIFFASGYTIIYKIYLFEKESISKPSFRLFSTVSKRHLVFSKSLIMGMFFYWVYTQGFLLWMENYLVTEEFNALRVILNITNVSNILLLVFDNYYITRQAHLYKTDKKLFSLEFFRLTKFFAISYTSYMFFFAFIAIFCFDIVYPQFKAYSFIFS